MANRALHIAWLGPAPSEHGGVPGVATELIDGLARRGHRIDCFFPSSARPVPDRLAANERVTLVWGTASFAWGRWYSRTRLTAFLSGMLLRAIASLRLRRRIVERHAADPYDLIYQFSSLEGLGVPGELTRRLPLVVHPETHAAGELRAMLAERALALRCQSLARFALATAIMAARALVQRVAIRRARLLVCISGVFRDHMVRDYGFPREATAVVPNPVALERFAASHERPVGDPPTVLVLGRVAARKGVETVVAVARLLAERGYPLRLRIVGGPSLTSDYTCLLADLPDNSEYAGPRPGEDMPGEVRGADLLLQASRYEPFALTVAEALAAGVPVVGTDEVGAIENVDRTVAAEVACGDVEAMAAAIVAMLEYERARPEQIRSLARAQAERLFAPEVVCEQIDAALAELLDRVVAGAAQRSSASQASPPRRISS
jgi:glycosyltransferase involved in cell wall biosynthesis